MQLADVFGHKVAKCHKRGWKQPFLRLQDWPQCSPHGDISLQA
jgi:hypothetical protein